MVLMFFRNWTINVIVPDVGAELPLWQHTVVNISSCMVMTLTASYRPSVDFFKDAVGIHLLLCACVPISARSFNPSLELCPVLFVSVYLYSKL